MTESPLFTDCSNWLNLTSGIVNDSSIWIKDGVQQSWTWIQTNLPNSSSNLTEISLLVSSFCSDTLNYLSSQGFTEFQLRLIQEFGLILLGNCLLVLVAWKIYGPRISDKFLKSGGSRKVIEELRLSMSELKLPKEHDFKYK